MADRLRRTVAANGGTNLAVPGGRTPEYIFPLLAKEALPWVQNTLTLADERRVDPDHPDSNEGLAQCLLGPGPHRRAR